MRLELLPYHAAIRDFLKRTDKEVWDWFASRRIAPQTAQEVRFDLLKSTYRIDRDAQPEVYVSADEVAKCLDVAVPLTLYQAQNPVGMNASLAYVPGEVHLVLDGPILTQLAPAELRGIFAHELAHYLLWESWNGELLIAADILQAFITDSQAHPAHFASWRLYRLYAEIFCDRAALAVTGDMSSVVSALVKVQTGVQEINADAYLRQADEIYSRCDSQTPGVTSEGVTHPEAFIRARAVRLWAEQHPERESLIAEMIEGRPGLDELDLLQQQRVAALTRRLIDAVLSRKWFQTDLAVAHARLFFEDYVPPQDMVSDTRLAADLRVEPASMRDYYCFLMLDLVTADRELDEPALAFALTLAEEWQIKPRFLELVRQELKLRKQQLERVDNHKAKILAEADRAVVST